jgi:hypothetical protein
MNWVPQNNAGIAVQDVLSPDKPSEYTMGSRSVRKPPDKPSHKKFQRFVGGIYEKMIASSSDNKKEAKLCEEVNFSTEVTSRLYRMRDIISLLVRRIVGIITSFRELMDLLGGRRPLSGKRKNAKESRQR